MVTLQRILQANGLSCLLFGLAFLVVPNDIGMFLGAEEPAPALAFQLVGSILLFNGLHLWWAASRAVVSKWLVLYFSLGDLLWVIGSLALLINGLWITTDAGIAATLVVAVMVGVFGVLQLKHLISQAPSGQARAVGQ
ncbi:hypothetical protein P2G88_06405 [Aliiglaciecola sp. CAU 1673]|uniref:hypothetical protein n=1 Tax=Aliiglaciecola sp. CAU 1673 TaxID=3032595 RepID=UPI0023DA74F2|nr:hypothetical protein [Aliiglaciecola sp. CAU 1673]MDF2177878.1 hypothetical protein [Aliiglaciecola sp. CAU 1673]